MRLVLLGTTGYHPSEKRHTACLMLPELGVLLDAGTGMFRAGRFLSTDTLDIFLTHAHLDHVIGLTYLFDVLRGRTMTRVTVHAPDQALQAIEQHLLVEPLFPVKLPCEFRPLADSVNLGGGVRLQHFALEHPGGSVGYRLDGPGGSLAYVTDTTASPEKAYVERLRGVDVLVHECYFPDSQAEFAVKTGHSFLSPVAEVARRAAVGRLVLVHVDPLLEPPAGLDLAPARAIFPNVELGYDLMEIDVSKRRGSTAPEAGR